MHVGAYNYPRDPTLIIVFRSSRNFFLYIILFNLYNFIDLVSTSALQTPFVKGKDTFSVGFPYSLLVKRQLTIKKGKLIAALDRSPA